MLGWRLASRSRTRQRLVLGAESGRPQNSPGARARRRSLRRRLVLGAAAAVALTAAGCGGAYSDLLAIERTGSLPDARVSFVINDGGTIRCDGGEEEQLPSKLLLEARDIVDALRAEFEARTVYPRSSSALLRFRAETADGEMAFSDVDGPRDPDVARLVLLVRRTAQQMCGTAR
ncbi:hypothetical protein [Conexibacter arvalis]|uniref:Uncharacterized protein n=1 Tax=Conexibacter arvalis TaxID=912552 RepID=A0A840IHV5_9ACTN|nr:hypothetical protein [Conexibacter arvalis]MBB4664359.1 hypothetical protein [Conexibacter arvalis]